MSYSIRPGEMALVFRTTGAARDELLATFAKVDPHLEAARAATTASHPIGSALSSFRAEHKRLIEEVALRIDSALYYGQEAVEAYVRADAQMAEQYGRASVVFAGDRLPPDLGAEPGAAAGPVPEIVRGG
jgi:hypothetical protein